MSVKEAAFGAGYRSQSHFARMYRRKFGESPSSETACSSRSSMRLTPAGVKGRLRSINRRV
ncbi:MAG: helix-turn-helix domain-containing protein [Spirochaetota bacterium]